MSKSRALRALFVANDGFSAGHVARTLAVARGLSRRAAKRQIEIQGLLATTSEAHTLIAPEPLAVVRLPPPVAARRAGLSDQERRHLVRTVLEAAASAFAPDLVVVDTFPSGPHGELAGWLFETRARRALVRRSVPENDASDLLTAGLSGYDLAIVASDPLPTFVSLPIRTMHVPPITIDAPRGGGTREAARAALGISTDERVMLVAAGGGGDEDAVRRATSIAETIARVDPTLTVALAPGPLSPALRHVSPRIRIIHAAPLGPLAVAFDGAFAPAGYNTAHELARARVPAALFAQPRPFDDQAGRAARFEKASFARVLDSFDAASIEAMLAWMKTASIPALEAGGADRAADALLDLVTRGA